MKFTNFLKLIVCSAIFICPLSAEKDIFLLATVPKSGTHLIQNLINIFTGKNKHFFHNAYELNGLNQNEYATCHFKNLFNPNVFLKKFPDAKYIINVRDPRDVCVSSVYYYRFGFNADFNTKLSFTITNLGLLNYFGVYVHFARALDAIKQRPGCVVKFEELVGPHGGGDLETQIKTIQKVGLVFNMDISREEAIQLGEQIYGHSDTFRSGQIGSWKKHFTAKHIAEFKKSPLQRILVELGYEKDNRW